MEVVAVLPSVTMPDESLCITVECFLAFYANSLFDVNLVTFVLTGPDLNFGVLMGPRGQLSTR